MKIKFICGDRHVAKHFPVKPASKERPDWYNKLPGFLGEPLHSPPTIKKCMPIYDHMTAGYIIYNCLLYTSPSPRDQRGSRMPSSA